MSYNRNEKIWVHCDWQPEQLQGKRIWAEYRLARRTHHVGVGHIHVTGPDTDGHIAIDVVFTYDSIDPAHNDFIFHVSQPKVERIVPTTHHDYDFRFLGTLDWEDGLTEDTPDFPPPPKVVDSRDE